MTHCARDFIEALLSATREGRLQWRMDEEDPERELYVADAGSDLVQVEILLLAPVAESQGTERAFARLVGLGLWEVFARGTPEYAQVMEMLALNIVGWDRGRAGHDRALAKAIDRIKRLGKPAGAG